MEHQSDTEWIESDDDIRHRPGVVTIVDATIVTVKPTEAELRLEGRKSSHCTPTDLTVRLSLVSMHTKQGYAKLLEQQTAR